MNFSKRFKKLAAERSLSIMQLAELFGVDYQTAHAWYTGKTNPAPDVAKTLERFERDQKAVISPRVSERTAHAFYGVSA